MKNNLRALLFLTIFVSSAVPLVASVALLDEILNSTLGLSFNERMRGLVVSSMSNLKTLASLDPKNSAHYKEQFVGLQDLQLIYDNDRTVRSQLRSSLLIYFTVCTGVAVLVAVILSLVLSRRISRMYENTSQELAQQREKNRFLENVAQWQDVAKRLAHEVKNPLLPIELSLRSLIRAFENISPDAFKKQLEETSLVVGEELGHLRLLVQNFSRFAKLPEPKPEVTTLKIFFAEFISRYGSSWPEAEFKLITETEHEPVANLDAALFRQVLGNLVQNAIEANPGAVVQVTIRLLEIQGRVRMRIHNTGAVIPLESVERIFDPYVSTKSQKENMGLGLAIARKIVIDQGGDLFAVPCSTGAEFLVEFPIAKSGSPLLPKEKKDASV